MKMDVLILANGEMPSPAFAQRMAAEHDLLIATDGAAQKAITLGVTPDTISGDFDSVEWQAVHAAFPDTEIVATPDQSYGDLEKALLLACERGATRVTVMGAAGGRIDHMLANFSLLLSYQKLSLTIVDDRSRTWAVVATEDGPGTSAFLTCPGDTVSLISFSLVSLQGLRVSITGVRWELQEYPLTPGTRGISNLADSDRVEVTVHAGAVIVCHLPL